MRKIRERPLARAACVFVLATSFVCGASNCTRGHAQQPTPTAKKGARKDEAPKIADAIFDKGTFGKDWNDWGWAPRDLDAKSHARLDFSNYGGWILQKSKIGAVGGVVIEYRAQAKGDFLEVRFANEFGDEFPAVNVGPNDRVTRDDGTELVFLSIERLNPQAMEFDRITIRAMRALKKPWVEIDRIGFTKGNGKSRVKKNVVTRVENAEVTVDCSADLHAISPYIYSIAYNARLDAEDAGFYWELNPPMRRWGGNPTSRYNYKHGRAWNTAEDWFYQNLNFTGDPTFTYRRFLDANARKNVGTALTIPAIGWVAKDTTSMSFPKSKFKNQEQFAPENGVAGNGKTTDGKLIDAGSPTQTSIKAPPSFVANWIKEIGDKARPAEERRVDLYFIDNEPMLWNSTHHDIHPDAVTYEELLKRSIDYRTVIRKHDPKAVIAGPAVWGWPAYFYSAKDSKAGFGIKPDRLRHGNTPLLEWYLAKLKTHRKKTGVRILDVLDVHFYPQGQGIYSQAGGGDLDARRIRSVRGLWDPTYVDESWINEPVALIPMLKAIIQKADPGLKLSIGEWSFGGERLMSGGIATAEALGQFGRLDVDYAFYWTYPKRNSPAFNAFLAFRNYDGKGARFLDVSVPTTVTGGASAFASTNTAKNKIVAVVINSATDHALSTKINIKGCAIPKSTRTFQFSEGNKKLVAIDSAKSVTSSIALTVPPLSVTVVELSK